MGVLRHSLDSDFLRIPEMKILILAQEWRKRVMPMDDQRAERSSNRDGWLKDVYINGCRRD